MDYKALLENVQEYSRLEMGKSELEKEIFDFFEITPAIVDPFKVQAKDRGLGVHLHLEDNLPAVYADQLKIQRILINLVSNAVKFTDRGYVSIEIKQQDSRIILLKGRNDLHTNTHWKSVWVQVLKQNARTCSAGIRPIFL